MSKKQSPSVPVATPSDAPEQPLAYGLTVSQIDGLLEATRDSRRLAAVLEVAIEGQRESEFEFSEDAAHGLVLLCREMQARLTAASGILSDAARISGGAR